LVALSLFRPDVSLAAETNARVVRIILQQSGTPQKALLTYGGTNIVGLRAMQHAVKSQSFVLTDRDVVLVQLGELEKTGEVFMKSIISVCEKTGAQLCFDAGNDPPADLMSIVVIHWKAPFKDPRNHSKTDYYIEGRLMGLGDAGLNRVLEQLDMLRPKTVALIPSRHMLGQGYGPLEIPYLSREKEVSDFLRRRNIGSLKITEFNDPGR
jgi:hypothetical protein